MDPNNSNTNKNNNNNTASGSGGDPVLHIPPPTSLMSPTSAASPTSPPAQTEAEKLARKRTYVIAEIVDTEKAYLDRLTAVFDVFIEPMRRMNIVDTDEVRNQFGFWEVMLGGF
jgi:hypothetical protein